MSINIKKEFISAIIIALKIQDNPFNRGLLEEFLGGIRVDQYKNFYSSLFGSDHEYLNGLDRVKKISTKYKEDIRAELYRDATEMATFLVSLVLYFEKINLKLNKENLFNIRYEYVSPKRKDAHIKILNNIYQSLGNAVKETSKKGGSRIKSEINSHLIAEYFGEKTPDRSALSVITGLADAKRAVVEPSRFLL